MSYNIEPTSAEFTEAENLAIDALSTECPTVMTRTGSVVRELAIRPMAYLYAWIKANFEALRKSTSVSYLKTSSATENSIADDVASNYFVTRNEGKKACGIITLTMTRPTMALHAGTLFVVDGANMVTDSTCVLSTGNITDQKDGVRYIKVFETIDDTGSIIYLANIPVVSVSYGQLEIAIGASVTLGFSNSYITKAELTSAITGGSNTETDAEMMARCAINTAASGIGSYNGLRKKLNYSPVGVTGMAVLAGDDKPLFRARYNNTNINPGGFVDCYIKTQKQVSTGYVTKDLTTSDVVKESAAGGAFKYTFKIDTTDYEGAIAVPSVYTNKSGNIKSFSVSFGSSDPFMDADGARLSCSQTITIAFISLYDDEQTAQIRLEYMPGLKLVHEYMNGDDNKFIGQDVCIKTAIPAAVSMQCAVSCYDALTESDIQQLKKVIADYINNIPVGCGVLNFSDLRTVCNTAMAKADLRLPCSFTARVYIKDGSRDISVSNTGVLDITNPASTSMWNSTITFFCTTEEAIRIEQV